MDVTSIAAASTELAQMKTGDAVGISVLKKAIQIETQGALMLLEALPQPVSNPPHLGNQVDVKV